MELSLKKLTSGQIYFNMIQTLVPRPIAWVLSENAGGRYNLAPFSYFTAICSDPPLILISIGKKPDGTPKDTRVNIEVRKDFVVHIAHSGMVKEVNESSATLPPEVSEVEMLGLETVPLQESRLPRLKEAPIAYVCEKQEIIEMGAAPQALVIGRVKAIYLDDRIMGKDDKGRDKVLVERLDPLARLGADEYARLGEVIRLARPK